MYFGRLDACVSTRYTKMEYRISFPSSLCLNVFVDGAPTMSDVNSFQSRTILFENELIRVNFVACSLNILYYLAPYSKCGRTSDL